MAKLKEMKKQKAVQKAEAGKFQQSSSTSKKTEKKNTKRDTEEENAEDNVDPEIPSGKVKKVRKNKRKHCVEASELADNAGESERIAGETKSKVKEARKNKKKKRVSPKDESELADELAESKTDNGDQISTGEDSLSRGTTPKLKRARKSKRKDRMSPKDSNNSVQTEDESYEIHQISSGEEDCSRGMKKWVKEYHMNRPGFEVLQQKIDDFITAFEEQEEQARKDTEAKIAEDGWTVVVHRKGGKKTSDPESGVVVGSVSQGAVLHRMDKKKIKEVGPDFYRFQRREAQRSEVMKLQSKFEEDKKRIQQLRAARKFKPY